MLIIAQLVGPMTNLHKRVELIAGEVRSDRRKGRNKIVLLFLGIAL
jgi:hypothetical protein